MNKVWTNQHVLFVLADLDDSGMPYRAMRVLAHLRRRLGKRKSGQAAGIRRMAEVCRMDGNSVEQALGWLERHGLIKIHRERGKLHEYELLINRKALYVDHRVDDLGLSPVQLRVLAHMARLANERGEFFISERQFAKICGMKRDTIHAALEALEQMELYGPLDTRKNPVYALILSERFPREPEIQSATDQQPNDRVGLSATKMPNGMPDSPNGSGPKDTTPMPDPPNSGWPDSPNERQSSIRQSNKDNPIDNPKKSNPASCVNATGSVSLFLLSAQIRENEFPELNIRKELENYESELSVEGRRPRS